MALSLIVVIEILLLAFHAECDSIEQVDIGDSKILSPSLFKHSCQKFDEDGLRHLGTKTPYRVVANTDEATPTYEGTFDAYLT